MKKVLLAFLMTALPLPFLMGQNLISNPTFSNSGQDWGNFGATGFNAFFGQSDASLFADQPGNTGGVFQQGINGTAGNSYEFSLDSVFIESNWDADLTIKIEFYEGDDSTLISEASSVLDVSGILGDFGVPGGSISATAPANTTFVRPVVLFDNVQLPGLTPSSSGFLFDVSLSQIPEPSTYALLLGVAGTCLVIQRRIESRR
ncbi:PEP-CTERM sorting domain-containing protein [Rubellicoccus peritrichatus]|uniref:PEP-CTERM sorting domain-containing protein n=1 Tax=Rubellicoccus peritrichatus TaxID=3080537 RepID=A0AAQ3LGA7_9BACT|nr:PEP-CTERM sorting domain-containing protein [Puniceicoccus sp. CR14]WOO43345.1 PEP-CTERM sorting domain-containing protein [Puniceicoccus sp. CR14]